MMRRFIYWFFGINTEWHRQLYRGAREYPLAIIQSLVTGFIAGSFVATLVCVLAFGMPE